MKFLDVKTDYAFKKVFGSKESVPFSPEELELQEKDYDYSRMQKGSIELAREQRMEQTKLSIAKKRLDILDDKMIAEKTGLSVETIKVLR